MEDLLVRYARCCKPIPGDDIVGFITRGRGITVHRRNCPYVAPEDPGRLVPVEWENDTHETHEIDFSVICDDRPGMLNSITTILGGQDINISKLKATSLANGSSVCVFRIMIKNLAELETLFTKIKKLSGVEKIERPLA